MGINLNLPCRRMSTSTRPSRSSARAPRRGSEWWRTLSAAMVAAFKAPGSALPCFPAMATWTWTHFDRRSCPTRASACAIELRPSAPRSRLASSGDDRPSLYPRSIRSVRPRCPPILDGLLRARLGFGGVIITDAMDMAPVARYGALESARMALSAGADLVLLAHLPDRLALVRRPLRPIPEQRRASTRCGSRSTGRCPIWTWWAARTTARSLRRSRTVRSRWCATPDGCRCAPARTS